MDGTAEGLLASRRIFDEALSRFDRAMGTSLGGGVPSGGDEASAGAAVQSHRPSSSVVSERYLPLPLTLPLTLALALALSLRLGLSLRLRLIRTLSLTSGRYDQYQLTAEGGAACAVQLELL